MMPTATLNEWRLRSFIVVQACCLLLYTIDTTLTEGTDPPQHPLERTALIDHAIQHDPKRHLIPSRVSRLNETEDVAN